MEPHTQSKTLALCVRVSLSVCLMLLKAFSFSEHLKANAKTCVYNSDCVAEFKINAGVSLGVFFL